MGKGVIFQKQHARCEIHSFYIWGVCSTRGYGLASCQDVGLGEKFDSVYAYDTPEQGLDTRWRRLEAFLETKDSSYT